MAKKILHVTYDMRIGGTERVLVNLINSAEAPYQMSVYCIEEPLGPWGIELQEQGIKISQSQRAAGFDRTLIKDIRAVIQKQKIDVVHCHQYTPWVYGALAAVGTSARVVFTEHGRFYPDRGSWKRRLVNPLLNRVTGAITSISVATADALEKFEYLPRQKIRVVYNGIEAVRVTQTQVDELRAKLALPTNALILGTIARLDPIKNHSLMLQAFAQVYRQHPNARLIIVGDGEEKNNIEKLAQKLAIEDALIMPGYHSDPSPYLALMDIFLLSSLSEGTSMTLLEAMSLGKPCVVTDAGGNAEVIADQVNGLVTKNQDVDAFANAILQLVQQPELRQSYAEQAKARFIEMFSVEKMSREYREIYGELG